MANNFRLNRKEFDKALREEAFYSKRDNATICNTHAYYISRGCARNTPKSTKAKIRSDLMMDGRLGAALLYLIVNSGRHPGLYGDAMAEAAKKELASRKRALLAAGWVPSIKRLEPYAEKIGGGIRGVSDEIGSKAKGYAIPARDGWKPKATIVNENQAAWDTRDNAVRIAGPVLQSEFDKEEAKMAKYIERKQREAARKAGIRIG